MQSTTLAAMPTPAPQRPLPSTRCGVHQPRYGGPEVLERRELPLEAPGPKQVLVEIHAASVCKGDVHLLTGKPYLVRAVFGFKRPRHEVIGQDLAGVVLAVGAEVEGLTVGDRVFGPAGKGAFADYALVDAARLARMPDGLSFPDAAAVPDSALTALQGLKQGGGIQPGQRVLVNGASGGVGSHAVQIAKAQGAHVTAVCSTRHVEMVRGLGADVVIDYTQEDFREGQAPFDLILDMVGNHSTGSVKRGLTPKGTLVSGAKQRMGNWVGPIVWLLGVAIKNLFTKRKLVTFVMEPDADDLRYVRGLLEQGQLHPVIEHEFPLDQTAQAIAHVAEGHAQGKTVIRVR